MRKAVQFFVTYPIFAYMMIPILLIGGIYSFATMKRSFFPEIETRDIYVTVFYPGASPKEMEEGITMRIEHAVRGIVGIKEIKSTSSENFSSVTVTTTGEYDIDETLMEVKNAVDGISSFPVLAERPIVYKQRSQTMAMFLSITGDADLGTLKRYAYDIEDDFLASGLVSQTALEGFPQEEISVEVKEDMLLRYGITFDDISNAIAMNNTDMSAGQIKSKKEEILIRSRYRSVNPNKIGDIIIKASPDGKLIKIRDIGEVKIKFADETRGFTQNGELGVSLNVSKLPEEDLVQISDYIHKYVKNFNQEHPEVTLSISYDFLEMLSQRLKLLQENGMFGLLLVIISLAFFLNIYLSFWVAWGIPASFLMMFMIGQYFGLTINMISLFGMILVIGILVDDGIVIGENIFAHFERGKGPRRAAIDGTMEVMPAVLTSITTTIIAFSPVLLIEQGGMEFMHDMAFVVIVSLAVSLWEAFFILPAHLSHRFVLRREEKKGIVRVKLDSFITFLRKRIYGNILKKAIKWRWVVVFSPIALLFITFGLIGGGFIKYTFFPNIEFDTFSVNFAFTPGTGEEKTLEYLARFEKTIWEVNEELKHKSKDTTDYIDVTVAIKGMAFEGGEIGSHAGRIETYFNELEGREYTAGTFAEKVREKIGPVPELQKYSVFSGFDRWGKPVSVSLRADDLDVLMEAKTYLSERMSDITSLKNITDNMPLGKQEVDIELKPAAYIHGLNQVQVANQIRQGFFGGQAQRLQYGKDELRVWVRYPSSGRKYIGQLEDMKIKTRDGEYPLTELVNYDIERSPVSIKRYNVQREVRIEADLVNPTEAVPPILENITNNILPEIKERFPQVDVEYMGQAQSSRESTSEMGKLFMIAFLIIIIIIVIHFKSFSQSFIILLMIPLGWIGAIWGHGIRDIPVSMLSAWGMVALTGVIINDAVVFISKFNRFLIEGEKIKDAVYKTGIARFRAILLTTITTTLGLFPLIIETSFQAQFLIPMAVSLAFGVLFGTGFILMFLPSLLLVWSDVKCQWNRIWTGNKECPPEQLEPAVINEARRKISGQDD